MATDTQDSNKENKIESPTNSHDDIKSHSYRLLSPDAELLSAADQEDRVNLNESTYSGNPEKRLSILEHSLSHSSPDISIPIRPWSDFSQAATSVPTEKCLSRSYKFVQLEQTLKSTKLIENYHDRIKFNNDYREALRENKFEEFSKTYHKKLDDHYEKIRQEHRRKMTRTFTFVDLEKNFLARHPTRDIKIIFIDDPIVRSTGQSAGLHPAYTAYPNSSLSIQSNETDIETFYENRLDYFLQNPSEARDEIILYARRAGELLHERLPRLSRVPHRVDIVDQRESKGNLDERTLLQMKHKHALSLVAHRRQLLKKMMTQAKKNQTKMEKLDMPTPFKMSSSVYFRDLFQDVNQFEKPATEEQQYRRPQTSYISRSTLSPTSDFSFSQIRKKN
ncbi:unnamed protein product [Rotaria magnacalcarata]|uniref:Uncharacterized protein n=5 Tax=Rotaria magnacalcarata TaxID=392030 RepID=A0A816AGA4_9BILA|nr:unnamed protein product [Rotaria magnacalcarata]